MKEPNLNVVYTHISSVDGKVFYVGSGGEYRPYRKAQRTDLWNSVAKNGYSIRIIKDKMSKEDSLELEEFLIEVIGIENLTNQGYNFKKGDVAWNKGLSIYNYMSDDGIKNSSLSNARPCVDNETGVIYNSLKHACEITGVSYSTTHKKLNGHSKNINNTIEYYGKR